MTPHKSPRLAFALALCAAAGVQANAQSAVDGAIGGTVQDASGAAVPHATVVIHFDGTNAEQTVTGDDAGFFRVIHLQSGTYTVTINAPGFEAFKSTQVTVAVGQLTDVPSRLTLGAASETIEVTSSAPAINTTSPDFANVIDQKVLEDLPVNNYRWSAYALLTPGVVESGGFGLLSFRGQSTLLNNVTFDGADDNQAFFSEERGRTRAGYSTAKASIQEFQVNTSNYSVEYGRSAGGVVNAVTKSGGNALHGEAYFYDREARWGAANSFNTHVVQTTPTTYASQVFKPKDVRKQYGIGLGGPIIKDKLFFFFAFDRFNRVFPGISAVPAGSAGIFYTPPDLTLPSGITCASATISAADAAGCSLAANLYGTGLKSSSAVTPGQYAQAAQLYSTDLAALNSVTGTNNRLGDQFIFFPKIDYQINGKNHASFEVNRLRWASPAGIQTSSSSLNYGVASFGDDFVKDTFVIGKLDSSINSKFSNEVRYQYGRDFEYEFNQKPTPYEQSTLLSPAGYTNPTGIPPLVAITNGLQIGTATFLNRSAYPDERRFQISDTANYVRGAHNLKFGVDYLHTNDFSQNLTSIFGSYSYGGTNYTPLVEYFTDLNASNACTPVTKGVAGAPQECYTNYNQGFGPLTFEFQTQDYAYFAQDEWKFSPRLSLTLGLRYEYEQFPNPRLPNPSVDANLINGSTSAFPQNKTNIGPRVGFALDTFGTGKTVLRGGYGEFFGRAINSTIYNAIAQTGSAAGQLSASFTNSNQTTTLQNSSATLKGPIFPQVLASSTLPASLTSIFYFDKNFKLPEIQEADLTVEQDLGWNSVFSISWLAAFGRRLPDFTDTNQPAAVGNISYTVVDATGRSPIPSGTVVSTPFYGGARPDTKFGAKTDIFSGVNSNYEAAVFHLTHRLQHRLQFDVSYTWSHALDYGENNTTFTNSNSLLDPHNVHAEYGNSNQNVPNRIIANAIYETPSTFHGFLGVLLNQYEISPSYQFQNGNGVTLGVTGSTSGLIVQGPNGGNITTAAIGSSINGSGGTNRVPGYARNYLNLPRTQLFDMRLSKRFKVRDFGTVEILGESFNLANHVNVTGVNTTAYAYGVGTGALANTNTLTFNTPFFTPTGANGNFIYTPRQVQVGARIQF